MASCVMVFIAAAAAAAAVGDYMSGRAAVRLECKQSLEACY